MSETIPTRTGRSLYGDNAYFGRRIGELAGRTTYWSMISLALGASELTDAQARLLDDLSVCGTAADPRVWPLKASRIAASWGSPMAGVAVGALHAGDSFIGPDSAQDAAVWLAALGAAAASAPDRDVVGEATAKTPRVPGFGVPLREVDERVVAIRRCVEERHSALAANHWRLCHDVEARLIASGGRGLNLSGALAALLLDLSFAPETVGPMVAVMVHGSYLGHAMEGAAQEHPLLQRLPDECVSYVGLPPRTSPRAAGSGDPPR